MKHLRDQAKSSMASKLSKYSSGGDVKRVEKGMPERDGSVGYARGGSVMPDDMGGDMPAKPRLDRGAKKKTPDAKKGVNVNIIVAPKPDKAATPEAPPMPPPGAIPPGPPPGPPMPPPPMRAPGGRVESVKGLVAKKGYQGGGGGGLGRLEKAKKYGK